MAEILYTGLVTAHRTVRTSGTRLVLAADGTLVSIDHLCPDQLRYSQIGAADGWRGRVVRAFFWLMRLWPTP